MAKTRTATGAGTIAIAALVLIFGNQAISEWISRHTKADTAWGWFLRQLSWPSWLLGPRDGSNAAMRDMLGQDLRAAFLVLFVALILAWAGKSIAGGSAGFVLGWAATIFGAALAAFFTAFIMADPSLLRAFDAAAAASAYGLFVGWIVGIAASTGKAGG